MMAVLRMPGDEAGMRRDGFGIGIDSVSKTRYSRHRPVASCNAQDMASSSDRDTHMVYTYGIHRWYMY